VATDLLPALLGNLWSIALVVLFFGGSIFVHELGHFLAARRRGVLVERFSIGFGPPLWSWRGRDGVEYRIAWFPLGGYVLLPELADLGAAEGPSRADLSGRPPVTYGTRMLVFAAGAACNLIFAFVLAVLLWALGQPMSSDGLSTRIGHVAPTLTLPDGREVPSPARAAGLEPGDHIRRIDGRPVAAWIDIQNSLILGTGRDAAGRPQVVFTVERAGRILDVTIHPQLAGDERVRRVGIGPGFELLVHAVAPDSPAAQAGFQPEDEILQADGRPVWSDVPFRAALAAASGRELEVRVRRAGAERVLRLPAAEGAAAVPGAGLTLKTGFQTVHVSPFRQLGDAIGWTYRTLVSLVHPRSDIGLDKMSGPVGIARVLHSAAEVGLRAVFLITLLLNVNLALFNLLPIPVLDGGHMLFATLGRLRGRPLPASLIAGAQSVFMVVLLSLVAYVTVFSDVPRTLREMRAERAAPPAAAPAAPAAPASAR
jgi:regulator of sigma E protease